MSGRTKETEIICNAILGQNVPLDWTLFSTPPSTLEGLSSHEVFLDDEMALKIVLGIAKAMSEREC